MGMFEDFMEMINNDEYREDYYRMENYQEHYYTQPEDNPLTDDYEVRVEEYQERIGSLQDEHVKRKEEWLEVQEQWEVEQAMEAKEAMKAQEEMFNDPKYIEMLEREAEYCFQRDHKDEETLQDKINEYENQEEIKEIVSQRGIEKLVHYTSYDNLYSILNKGLLSVNELSYRGIGYVWNDSGRYDGFRDAISISITFPNYMTFYRKRKDFNKRNWVVLVLDTSLLWKKNCLYSVGNAASYQNSNYLRENREELLNNSKSFKELFYEVKENNQQMITRQTDLIPEDMPTDPQAEVLVFDGVERNYIKEVHYSGFNIPTNIINNNPEIKFIKSNFYFNARNDYKYWSDDNGQ